MNIYCNVTEKRLLEKPIQEAFKILEENNPCVGKGYKLDKENIFVTNHALGVLVAFPLVGLKHKGKYRKGYQMCYVVNITIPMFSEYGDIYIDRNENGELYRAL